ncbi:Ribonuclease H [Abeliophyllum distichum]|uniref:Ribonuclease H n=1 Tax=Abeliophyllum distichum TaxID=126358 RepID=A0ABD1T0L0_9LAMI
MRELEWPQRMAAPPSKRDKRKYCHFHRDNGRDTENCFQLKEELERLLKRGFLARYMKNDRGKEMAVKSPTNPPPRARAVVSNYHQSMKFPMSRGVGCVRTDQHVSRRCYVGSIQVRRAEPVMMLDIEPLNGRIEPLNTTERIKITDGKMLVIGGGIPAEEKEKMIACLRDNLDLFAWTPNDIPGISPTISQHRLGVLPGSKPIKQKKEEFCPRKAGCNKTGGAETASGRFHSRSTISGMASQRRFGEEVQR